MHEDSFQQATRCPNALCHGGVDMFTSVNNNKHVRRCFFKTQQLLYVLQSRWCLRLWVALVVHTQYYSRVVHGWVCYCSKAAAFIRHVEPLHLCAALRVVTREIPPVCGWSPVAKLSSACLTFFLSVSCNGYSIVFVPSSVSGIQIFVFQLWSFLVPFLHTDCESQMLDRIVLGFFSSREKATYSELV